MGWGQQPELPLLTQIVEMLPWRRRIEGQTSKPAMVSITLVGACWKPRELTPPKLSWMPTPNAGNDAAPRGCRPQSVSRVNEVLLQVPRHVKVFMNALPMSM